MDPWCLASDVKARPDMGTLTDDQATLAAEVASELLFKLSGSQYGIWTETVRPRGCGRSCDYGPPSERSVVGWGLPLALTALIGPPLGAGPEGGIWSADCGGCGETSWSFVDLKVPVLWDDDSATRTTSVTTTTGQHAITGTFTAADVGAPISGAGIPVGATIVGQIGTTAEMSDAATASATVTATITGPGAHPITVTVDGDDLASDGTAWVLIDHRRLLRVDGGLLPRCQDLRLATTEVGTCQIVYSHGVPVPAAGKQAAISLAVQFALLNRWVDGECLLPQRVSTITRQGVSVQIVDSLSIIRDGGTGITDVDLWLQAVNPCGLRRRSRVYSPGVGNPLPQIMTGAAT